ncbi:hypothetical protein [Paenibacillus sp. O199]|uniref:hypothetical protein n=1 Tax=Paenibacillus sp. O199 TaxID=1643925 RepID=UPI0007BFAA18|nr:hypothetical protein [Paenibacillus sp. O199]
MRSQVDEKHEVELKVFDSYIREAEKNGNLGSVPIHALRVMRNRYEELMNDLESSRMLNNWAHQLVGNNGAFEEACRKWHESYLGIKETK